MVTMTQPVPIATQKTRTAIDIPSDAPLIREAESQRLILWLLCLTAMRRMILARQYTIHFSKRALLLQYVKWKILQQLNLMHSRMVLQLTYVSSEKYSKINFLCLFSRWSMAII